MSCHADWSAPTTAHYGQGLVDEWDQGAMALGLLEIWKENREGGGTWAWLKDRDREAWPLAPSHLHTPLSGARPSSHRQWFPLVKSRGSKTRHSLLSTAPCRRRRVRQTFSTALDRRDTSLCRKSHPNCAENGSLSQGQNISDGNSPKGDEKSGKIFLYKRKKRRHECEMRSLEFKLNH